MYRRAGTRVAAHTSLTHPGLESTKPDDCHLFVFLERFNDIIENGVDCVACLRFRDIATACYRVNYVNLCNSQFGFSFL